MGNMEGEVLRVISGEVVKAVHKRISLEGAERGVVTTCFEIVATKVLLTHVHPEYGFVRLQIEKRRRDDVDHDDDVRHLIFVIFFKHASVAVLPSNGKL